MEKRDKTEERILMNLTLQRFQAHSSLNKSYRVSIAIEYVNKVILIIPFLFNTYKVEKL